jgi:hypothetical protein
MSFKNILETSIWEKILNFEFLRHNFKVFHNILNEQK